MSKTIRGLACILFLLMTNAIVAVSQAQMFFSEYVEGSSLNKALEIYNGNDFDIDLSSGNYRIEMYFNGNTVANTVVALTGTIPAGGVYVIADDGADPAILAVTNQTTTASLFNGDDAIVLRQGDTIIDSIGQIGFDPGSEWGTGLISTLDNTLRRRNEIIAGDTEPFDVFDPTLEWEGFLNNTFDGLGWHRNNPDEEPEEPPVVENCGDPAMLISTIQGTTDISPLAGNTVSIEAIVVGDFQGPERLRGFFIQEEDTDNDGNLLTSEGIFVFDNASAIAVNSGDRIRVRGIVTEFNGLTELINLQQITVCASNQILPVPATVTLPVTALDHFERFEGMLVTLPQALAVNENFNLGRFGQVLLANGRLLNPTNSVAPGPDAITMQAANNLNRLLMDDGDNRQNPDPVIFPAPELTAINTARSGDTVSNITGILDFAFGEYRVLPTTAPVFNASNPRTTEPDLAGAATLKIASFNVLNYFNGDGLGGGFPTSRGANTEFELQRQRDKIVSAIIGLDADIVGLIEIENDGYAPESAIAELVNAINTQTSPQKQYAYVDPGLPQIGADEIAVGFIYRIDTASLYGNAAILSSSNSIEDTGNPGQPLFIDTLNRPALAQTFTEITSSEKFTVVVNHFKSKGSVCDDFNDPNTGDGQGNCNLTRTKAARALTAWLESDPTGSADEDYLIIGDLNAYPKEDPITVIKDAGYVNLIESFVGEDAYSYVFFGQAGYLDHALASTGLAPQVVDAAVWHINADEPNVLDYNVEFKSASHVNTLYSADAYRSSDHDPVIITLNLTPANLPPKADFGYIKLLRWVLVYSQSTDGDGNIASWQWDFGDGTESSGILALHRYKTRGTYMITHTVVDNDGATGSTTKNHNIR